MRGLRMLKLLAGVCAAAGPGWATPAAAQTVDDAMAAAYRTNPQLLAARQQLRALDEGVPQALSGWRPTVMVNGAVGKARDVDRSRDPTNTFPAFNERSWRTPDSASVLVTQPLYRGGQTLAGVSQAENQIQAGRAALQSVEQQVLLAAATAYINLFRDQEILDISTKNEQTLAQQLDATLRQFRVQDVTRTDLSQAESRHAQGHASRIQAEGNLAASRAVYLQVVGLPAPTRVARAHLPPGVPTSVADLEAGIGRNPDIAMARFNEKAAADGVDLVLGQKLPSVSLNGIVQRNTEVLFRGVQQDNATVSLSVTMPLYQAGFVDAQARAAKETAGQRRTDVETQRRSTTQAATQTWELLTSARAQVEWLQTQASAAATALQGVQREQQVGLRTVIEVLNAQQDVFTASINLVTAERDTTALSYQLVQAVGGLSASELALPVEIYDPVRHYDQERTRWFGTDIPDGDRALPAPGRQ